MLLAHAAILGIEPCLPWCGHRPWRAQVVASVRRQRSGPALVPGSASASELEADPCQPAAGMALGMNGLRLRSMSRSSPSPKRTDEDRLQRLRDPLDLPPTPLGCSSSLDGERFRPSRFVEAGVGQCGHALAAAVVMRWRRPDAITMLAAVGYPTAWLTCGAPKANRHKMHTSMLGCRRRQANA